MEIRYQIVRLREKTQFFFPEYVICKPVARSWVNYFCQAQLSNLDSENELQFAGQGEL